MEKPKQIKPAKKPVQPVQPLLNNWNGPSSMNELRRQLGWDLVAASRSIH